MNELPDNNHDEARRWLANVDDDLRALDAVLRDQAAPRRIVCFLAHLAVEKAFKAALIDAGVPFAKTHDVEALHVACVRNGRLTNLNGATIATLAPWAIDGRYGDDLRDASRAEADRLATFAHDVVAAVHRTLASS